MALEKLSVCPDSVLMSSELPLNQTNGVNNTINHLIPFFIEENIDLTIYSCDPVKGISIPFYPDLKINFVPWGIWKDYAFENQPEVFHAFAPTFSGLCGLEEMNALDIPTVASFNTNIPLYLKYYGLNFLTESAWNIFRYVHNNARLNLAPSLSVKRQMENNGIRNVKIWGRGVDNKLFSPEKRSGDFRKQVANGSVDKPIIIYAGRLAKEKNLEVFESLINIFPDFQFVFVGGGPLRQELQYKYSFSNVTFLDFLFGEKLAEAYASADIFVNPSLMEGYPNVVLESLSSGTPVIGFDAMGVGELIKNSNGGLVTPANDISALELQIRLLMQQKGLRQELSENGRQFALTRTWKHCFEELINYYNSIIEFAH